jgi:tripartite-type tricarboxylate transporter receptor subunit TctC
MPKLPYDPLEDFEPIALYGRVPFLLVVNALLGVRDLDQLAALAKQKPGQLNYASNGPAGSLHVMGELLKATLGLDIVHVPYKGVAPALLSVLANETQLIFDFPVTAAPHIRAGKLKGLLVTGTNRVPILTDVRTAREVGYPKLEVMASGGLMAPTGTPRDVILRLNVEMRKIMHTPSIATHRTEIGAELGGGSPEDFSKTIYEELAKWREIIRTTGVKIDQ